MTNIPIRTHAIIDYIIGLALLLSPVLMSFPDAPTKGIATVSGVVIILYSVLTDYPVALLRFVPFPIHRSVDFLVGAGLAFAPIHFAVHGAPAAVFIVAGVGLILMAFLTRGAFSPTGQDNAVFPGA